MHLIKFDHMLNLTLLYITHLRKVSNFKANGENDLAFAMQGNWMR